MPKSVLLPRLIHTILPTEQNRYVKWVEMELIDKPSIETDWFMELYVNLQRADFPESVKKEQIESWWQSFPGASTSNPRGYERINDHIASATEAFIAHQESLNVSYQTELNLVYGLSKRKARSLFVRTYNRLIKSFRTLPTQHLGPKFFTSYRQLLAIALEWDILSEGKRDRGLSRPDDTELSDCYSHLIHSLHAYFLMYKTNSTYSYSTYDQAFLDHLDTISLHQLPHLDISQALLRWRLSEHPPGHSELATTVNLILSNSRIFPQDQAIDFLNLSLNILTAWDRTHPRKDIITARFDIYHELMEVHFQGLPLMSYLNLIKGRLLEISWDHPLLRDSQTPERSLQLASNFEKIEGMFEQYLASLNFRYRAEAESVKDVLLAFEKGNLYAADSLIKQRNQRPPFHPNYDLSVKWVQIKIQFLLNKDQELIELMAKAESSLRNHIKRSPKTSYFRSLKSAIGILRRIYRAQYHSTLRKGLLHDIRQEASVEDKAWLISLAKDRFGTT